MVLRTLTVWHIRKRSFFFTREFALEQTCFLWFFRCACWVYGIIDWSASVLADLIICNFRSLSSSGCSANLGFMGNCRKSSSTSSKWSMRFPPFLGCSVWYFQAQTINTFSTLGCLHAVIQSLKMFEPAFNHVTSAGGCRCHWQEKLVNLHVCSCECCPTFSSPCFLTTRL